MVAAAQRFSAARSWESTTEPAGDEEEKYSEDENSTDSEGRVVYQAVAQESAERKRNGGAAAGPSPDDFEATQQGSRTKKAKKAEKAERVKKTNLLDPNSDLFYLAHLKDAKQFDKDGFRKA